MKKILFLIIAISSVAVLSSCNKEKNCSCTITAKASGVSPIVSKVETTIKEGKCSDLNNTINTSTSGITVVTTTECK